MSEIHNHEECSLHPIVMSMIRELKEDKKEMNSNQTALIENVIKITENLQEIKRSGDRTDVLLEELKKYNSKQDDKIEKNSMFVMKVLTIVGTISFIASISPLLLKLFGK